MPPIRLTRAERRSLKTLVDNDGRLPYRALPYEHAETFARAGMLRGRAGCYELTVTGQIEALRQHFVLSPWGGAPKRSVPPPPPLQDERVVRLPAFLNRAA